MINYHVKNIGAAQMEGSALAATQVDDGEKESAGSSPVGPGSTRNSSTKDVLSRLLARFGDRPWIYHLFAGLMWLFMVVVAIGKGQDWAVFCAFLGMLWWALLTKDYEEVHHDLLRALDGWTATVNEYSKHLNAAPQGNKAGNVSGSGGQAGTARIRKSVALPNNPAVAAHIQTDRCGFDRNSSLSEDTYVCECGWREHG